MSARDSRESIPASETSSHAEWPQASEEVVRQFVEHWGMMARSWGINATMGELFALLYISGTDWTADSLRERLQVSRGNVSMNLRELMAWGVVHKIHRPGERREFYRAETDVWTLFRRILAERKRRELDPTLVVLRRTVQTIQSDPALTPLEGRIASLQHFFGLIDVLATRLLTLKTDDIDELAQLFGTPDESSSARSCDG
jgi:DNA-binding transcriptional regulator GbsR (MarR family)